jgi:clathrin heavy chain
MPYFINVRREQIDLLERLNKDNEERKQREREQSQKEAETPILGGARLMITQGTGTSTPGFSNGLGGF